MPTPSTAICYSQHRYYGQSLPPGAGADKLQYLMVDQAMADYAILINHVKETFSCMDRYVGSILKPITNGIRSIYSGATAIQSPGD